MANTFDIKKIFKGGALVLFVLVLLLLGAQLFFGDQIMFLAKYFTGTPVSHSSAEKLTIAYALPVQSLEPTLFDPTSRSRLINVYEGLVRTDRNLKIVPAIAVSWGLVDPLHWDFTLRPHVKFHNGKEVTPDDIVASIDRARNYTDSQLKTFLNTITELKIIDASTLRITTKTPDPLLLNKLAVVFIFPKDYTNFDSPVGTGPYEVVSWKSGGDMSLKRFSDYWGTEPFYAQVDLRTIPDKDERLAALKKDDVQLLADVPPSASCTVDNFQKELSSCTALPNITLKTVPSLQVNFLMLNVNQGLFKEKALRQALAYALDGQEFVKIADGYAQPIHQFVSSGVFGFNPDLKGFDFDMEKAKAASEPIVSQSFEKLSVTLDYTTGDDVVVQYVQEQLKLLGIDVVLNPLSPDDFQKKLLAGNSEMYYLGWRSELGDASDFLESIIHSRDATGLGGQFNGTNYVNKDVDALIDSSQQDLNQKSRLKSLQDAMKILVENDIVGIPLFETQTLFANQNTITFEPRVDGYIYAAELR